MISSMDYFSIVMIGKSYRTWIGNQTNRGKLT